MNRIFVWCLFFACFVFLVYVAGRGKMSVVQKHFGWPAVVDVVVVVGILGALWDWAVDAVSVRSGIVLSFRGS